MKLRTRIAINRTIKLLNKLIWLTVVILITLIVSNVIWNNGHYSGRVAGEAGVMLFQRELSEAIEQGYTFKWYNYRFIPAKTKTNGMRNVMIKTIPTNTKE